MPDKLVETLKSLANIAVETIFTGPLGFCKASTKEFAGWGLVHWLPNREVSTLRNVISKLEIALQAYAEGEGLNPDVVVQAMGNAKALFEAHPVTVEELVHLKLSPENAARELIKRGDTLLEEPVLSVRDRIVRTIYDVLLTTDQGLDTLTGLRTAINRKLLNQLDDLQLLPAGVMDAIQTLYARTLVTIPSTPWRENLFLPSAMLTPTYGVVPFHPQRDEVCTQLEQWCLNKRTVGVQLIVAPGGAGKTRLALELCRRMLRAGFFVGFLDKRIDEAPAWVLDHLLAERQLLLVIDYAELRQKTIVEVARRAIRASDGCCLRLLLLARSGGDWLRELEGEGNHVGALLSGPCMQRWSFTHLAVPAAQRPAIFQQAVTALAQAEKTEMPIPSVAKPSLAAAHFERLLFLHLAAFAFVHGQIPEGEEALLDFLLKREQRLWNEALVARRMGSLKNHRVAQAAALLTFVGGNHDDNLRAALLKDAPALHVLSEQEREDLYRLLTELYPSDGTRSVMTPDLLGERLVEQELEKDERLLDTAFGPHSNYATRCYALTVLTRLARRKPSRSIWLGNCLRKNLSSLAIPAVIVAEQSGDPIGRILADVLHDTQDIKVACALVDILPDETVALREVAAVVARLQVNALSQAKEKSESQRHDYAKSLSHLSRRLVALSCFEEALQAIEEAVRHWRQLAETGYDVQSDLAVSLNILFACLSSLGHHKEALQPIGGAVKVCRLLVEAYPGAFQSELAMSLTNLATCFSNLGHREEALPITNDAVEVYRKLAIAWPSAFRSDLAASLNNLSDSLSALNRHEQALQVVKEAVELYRELADVQPDAFRPSLAMSLNNLSTRLSALTHNEEALQAIEEAVEVRRTLAKERPDTFRPDLAMSLNNLSLRLSAVGRNEEALHINEEAVELFRTLEDSYPDAFRSDLAMSLTNLSVCRSKLYCFERALQINEEAVQLYRIQAGLHPDGFQHELAMSLRNLCNRLSALGRHDEALHVIEEAVVLYRKLATECPDAFQPDLAMSLNNLSVCFANLECHEKTMQALGEAVEIYRKLGNTCPDAFRVSLVVSLKNLYVCLSALGRHEEAIQIELELKSLT